MQELYFAIVIPYGERRINRNWRIFCLSARVVTYQTSRSRPHKRTVVRVAAGHPHLHARSDAVDESPLVWTAGQNLRLTLA